MAAESVERKVAAEESCEVQASTAAATIAGAPASMTIYDDEEAMTRSSRGGCRRKLRGTGEHDGGDDERGVDKLDGDDSVEDAITRISRGIERRELGGAGKHSDGDNDDNSEGTGRHDGMEAVVRARFEAAARE